MNINFCARQKYLHLQNRVNSIAQPRRSPILYYLGPEQNDGFALLCRIQEPRWIIRPGGNGIQNGRALFSWFFWTYIFNNFVIRWQKILIERGPKFGHSGKPEEVWVSAIWPLLSFTYFLRFEQRRRFERACLRRRRRPRPLMTC